MSDDRWSLTSSIGTSKAITDKGVQIWCATRADRTLSCQVRVLAEGSGWEVVIKTGVDRTRPHWLIRWLLGEGARVVDCRRQSHELVLTRRCADEGTARFLTEGLREDYMSLGWVQC